MEVRKLKKSDNDLGLLFDFYKDEFYSFYDWKKLKAFEFEEWEECENFLKGNLQEDLCEYLVSCKAIIEHGHSVGIDKDDIKRIAQLRSIFSEYDLFKKNAPGRLKELITKYESEKRKYPAIDPIYRYRFVYLFDPENHKSATDEENSNYTVYSWHVENGKVFYVGYSNDGPALEKKHSCQTEYWNRLLEKYTVAYNVECSGLTEKQAIIMSKCLQLEYTEKGDFVLGYTAERYRVSFDGDYKQYVHNRTTNHVFIDEFYRKFFPEYVNQAYSFDTPTIDGLSDTSFSEEGWTKKKGIVEQWIKNACFRLRKKVGKTSKSIIVNGKSISLTQYLSCKANGCSIYLIDDVLAYLEELDLTTDYHYPLTVPKYDAKERERMRIRLRTLDAEVAELVLMNNLDLEMKNDYSTELVEHFIFETAIAKQEGYALDPDFVGEMMKRYVDSGLFDEALQICEEMLEKESLSEDEYEEFRFEAHLLKKIITADNERKFIE